MKRNADECAQAEAEAEAVKEEDKKDEKEEDGEKDSKKARLEDVETPKIDGVEIPEKLRGFIERVDPCRVLIKRGLAKDMRVDGLVFANEKLLPQMLAECSSDQSTFIGALIQVANVASVPGLLNPSLAMPDAHSGYGFSIGGVAAVDMDDPDACVCPGGVGYDINCGVSLLRSNLDASTVLKTFEQRNRLAEALFARIPVGVGCENTSVRGPLPKEVLTDGLPWLVKQGHAWAEDVEHCEERGCVAGADPKCVSQRAMARGRVQLGTLGSGNHYVEVQAVDEIYDPEAAETMGLNAIGRVCVMVHSGSRGFGHQVCTDALTAMQKSPSAVVNSNDPQLTGVPIKSAEGQKYMKAMACAANYAFVNRGSMRQCIREAFVDCFAQREGEEKDDKYIEEQARKMDMHLVYDVCHNLAKVEDHAVDGKIVHCLVHRKGATRAFPPEHATLPDCYKRIGQPIIIGGSMGTCSYVLTGTERAMNESFGSTCHGAGRALSRSVARKTLPAETVMKKLADDGIVLKIATPKDVAEEASAAYKDVSQVVQTCHDAGISKLCVRLRPLIVCKG